MQKYVDRGYDQFTTRVARGRHMDKQKVLRIAEGRVWDAQTAKRIGLVDALGGLREAIEWTASKAGIASDYDVAAYPRVEPTIWNMMQLGSTTMGELKTALDARDEDFIRTYLIKRLMSRRPVQARMPEMRISL